MNASLNIPQHSIRHATKHFFIKLALPSKQH